MEFDLKVLDPFKDKLTTAEIYDSVVKAFTEAFKPLILDTGNLVDSKSGEWMPRTKLNEETQKLKDVISAKDTELSDLAAKIKAGGNAAELIETMKTKAKDDAKTYAESQKETAITHAIQIEILKAGPRKPDFLDAITGQIDRSVVSILEKTGAVIGVEEQLKKLKDKESPFADWFGVKSVNGKSPEDSKNLDVPDAKIAELQTSYDNVAKSMGAISPEAIAAKRVLQDAKQRNRQKEAA